ncbi:MAG: hypothetical protein WCE61_14690 [Candidatus Acidiferrum sp.]
MSRSKHARFLRFRQQHSDRGQSIGGDTSSVLHIGSRGGNADSQIVGLDELPGKSSYFIGNDPTKWRTDVPTYARVLYRDVYPGVDLAFYGHQRQLECDLVLKAGANPEAISLSIEGASEMQIDASGDLKLKVASGEVRFRKPAICQGAARLGREVE